MALRAPVRNEPADMVGMHVRDEDGADGFGRHTERSKRGWQAPGGGSAHTGIAGIDQHQSVAVVHEPDREAEAMHAERVMLVI
jgi:hypothetical protein